MNIYLAFSLFALIILVYWVISELFAMLFRFTGLPDEKARFQVISLLTGTGFTTRESEMILSTRSPPSPGGGSPGSPCSSGTCSTSPSYPRSSTCSSP